ncbi:MAG: enoyl-CoA hydratase/isomerase family protein [Desulfobacterales bacterium]|jgi:enoyl-CoA hydratase|nr:enoyl-CoA hydratase/isomerase family protein [Desulfobacterales bacterium]MBT7697853.1 enoyl-CoA hydratase/isomerase family protein [Desulfobacterales bacterium]
MSYKNIIFEIEKPLAVITFNRPDALNALNRELLDEFDMALDEILSDEDIRVLIVTGMGKKSFVAGADISELDGLNALQAKYYIKKGQDNISRLQELPIPVIAAVNGFALGGGCEMALGCDIVYASENAKFGLPEITLGFIPGYGGTQRLAKLVGPNVAKEMIFTGKMISAGEAKEIGLVNRVCPVDSLIKEAKETAMTISDRGKVSIRAAKQAVNIGMDTDMVTGCKVEADACAMCMASEDAKEGTSAFLEKRKPDFKGKLYS